jgi:hypothetical protein
VYIVSTLEKSPKHNSVHKKRCKLYLKPADIIVRHKQRNTNTSTEQAKRSLVLNIENKAVHSQNISPLIKLYADCSHKRKKTGKTMSTNLQC